jgi:uncharacterized Rmd1/YagE family protein
MDDITEGRFALVDDRLDHYGERLDKLEAEEKHAEGMRLNWIVVALFAVELALGAWQVWWVMRHA